MEFLFKYDPVRNAERIVLVIEIPKAVLMDALIAKVAERYGE